MYVFVVAMLTNVSHTTVPDVKIDEYLLQIAEKKDQEALAELYRATSKSIYAYALSVLKNPHDAEDVLQECYLKIFSSANTYRSKGKPLAWMITITRNLCLERLREREWVADFSQEDWENLMEVREDISSENRIVLKECMRSLNDSERQIVVLHAVSGFKHREIASLLGLPISTVLSKYNRAVKKLKSLLVKGDY